MSTTGQNESPSPAVRHIKILMLQAGVTPAKIAAEFGVSRSMISQVMRGVTRSQALEDFIEERLGVEPGSLFPHGSEEHENPQEKGREDV